MHSAAYAYVRNALGGVDLAGKTVLEIGAYNVNGSVRPLFAGCAQYIGIDRRPGPGVDVVGDGRRVDMPDGCADVVVCCETLEHTPRPWAIIMEAERLLRTDGVLILTAANPQRVPHGCDGGPVPAGEHYGNIADDDLAFWLSDFRHWELDNAGTDIRAKASK